MGVRERGKSTVSPFEVPGSDACAVAKLQILWPPAPVAIGKTVGTDEGFVAEKADGTEEIGPILP